MAAVGRLLAATHGWDEDQRKELIAMNLVVIGGSLPIICVGLSKIVAGWVLLARLFLPCFT
jgi:hypothetical protein